MSAEQKKRKSQNTRKRSEKAGLLPGTLVHIGDVKNKTTKISYIAFNETDVWEDEVQNVAECLIVPDKKMLWINIAGISNTDIIEEVGKCFSLHPLLLEDVVNTEQRAKVEDYGEYLFIVMKMLYIDETATNITSEQISIVLGPDYVISFQEHEPDVFDQVRKHIRNGKGRIRQMGSDYIAYSLIDAIVDNYFEILEKFGEKVDTIEDQLVVNPTREILVMIHIFKREMIYMRKAVWPVREVLNALEHGDSDLIKDSTVLYVRDAYDHTIQIIDTMETYRDMVSGMMDIYLSSISNRMNEIMKVLTIIATFFMPLTFIVGVYGMNFEHMPELKWQWGYFAVWMVILVVTLLMFLYFRRRKWL